MADPLKLLANDRRKARAAGDPWANLCVLATIDARQNPQARVVVLRDLDNRLAIFINATSPKHAHLKLAERHALLVYLASLGAQYRLAVTFEPVPVAIVHQSWLERPRIPKVMDWLYEQHQPQSSRVPSRKALSELYARTNTSLPEIVAAPSGAIGFFVVAHEVERLELAGDRMHTRRGYRRTGARWTTEELIP